MKFRLYCILLLSMVLACACSQNGASQRLEAEIEAANRQCPVSLGPNGYLTKLEYDKGSNTVTMSYRLNRYYADPAALANSSQEQRREMAAYLRKDENRPLLDLFVNAGASLALSFLIGDATEPVVLTLPASELRAIANQADERANLRVRLNEIAQTENAMCPSPLADGITATAVMVDNEFLTYEITVPDSVALATSAQQGAFRSKLIANIDSARTNSAVAPTLRLLHDMEYGIRYRIFNRADSLTFVIDITPAEI